MTGWDDIAARWEREPWASEQSPAVAPPIAAVYEAVVEACAAAATPSYRQRLAARLRTVAGRAPIVHADAPRVRFDVDGSDARLTSKRLLPHVADGSFEGWHARARVEAGRRRRPARIGLIVNYPELVSPMLWGWARGALRDLYVRTGMNNGSNFCAVFAGDYRRTAMGVHDDPESALHFPLLGRKVIRCWEPEAIRAFPEIVASTRYDRAVSRSTTIAAGPGGVVYWPSRLWHVGESDGELGVSLSFGLELGDALQGSASRRMGFDPGDWQAMAERVPDTLLLDGACDSAAAVQLLWLRRLTAGNFGRVPPLAPEVALPDFVRGDADWPPVWCRLDRDHAAVAANGHATVVRWSADLPGFVAAIAAGDGLPVLGLQSAFPGVPVASLVGWLLRARALSPFAVPAVTLRA